MKRPKRRKEVPRWLQAWNRHCRTLTDGEHIFAVKLAKDFSWIGVYCDCVSCERFVYVVDLVNL